MTEAPEAKSRPRWQRRLIRTLLVSRERSPSWGRSLQRIAVILAGWAVVCGVFVWLDGGLQSPLLPFCGGILVGLLAANIAWVKMSIRNWALLKNVIDWARVEELAGSKIIRNEKGRGLIH